MEMQSTFVTNIHATYGEAGTIWLEQLSSHLDLLSKQWNFRLIHTLPNLSYSYVALVELNSNHEIAILKTAPMGSGIISEVRWFSCFKRGVPRVFHVDEEHNAFLMERLDPGVSLKSLVKKAKTKPRRG
jgi:streptomycin 6-kinase